jgi:L,D-peptidoglycan transpeptidase YkuD (ErfK/YbiS/YcfS/YnhG family)
MDIVVEGPDRIRFGDKIYRCAVGKGGIQVDKTEGDGVSPVGSYPIRSVYYRKDRIDQPKSVFETHVIQDKDGWCDASEHPSYNKPVSLPFAASHEVLMRDDHIYDVIVVLGHNDDPPIPYKGSAIFFHIARADYSPTEGCIAVQLDDMFEILRQLDEKSRLIIQTQT